MKKTYLKTSALSILSGNRKGLKLQAPQGLTTRPTSTRAKESLFNHLNMGPCGNFLFQKRWADVFAGTGAIGLEALSRGAHSCTFCEISKPALQSLKVNIKASGFEKQTVLYPHSFFKLKAPLVPFDVIFIDPPYGQINLSQCLEYIIQQAFLSEQSLIIIQHDRAQDPNCPSGYSSYQKGYGRNQFTFIYRTPSL